MRAAVYHGAGDIRVEHVDDPAPGPGELLLEIHAVGICGTDVGEYVHGPVSYRLDGGSIVPGHELAGRVVAAGREVDGFAVGSVVASGAGISCGECFQCRAGRTNLCLRYTTVGLSRDGALAQFCAVPAATCLDVAPYGLDEQTAALAQPMAIAAHSLRRGRPEPGDDVVVIGAGGIGAFLIYAAARLGARVAAVDLDEERLALARSLGAAETIVPDPDMSLRDALADRGLLPLVVYEATGSEQVLAQATDVVVPGGRLVVVGLQERPREVDLRRLTLSEVELVGTNAHVCSVDLPRALELLAARGGTWADVAPVVLPLERLVSDGIAPMAEGRGSRVKTLVDPWADELLERA